METLNQTKRLPKCPSESVNICSYLTFAWVLKIFFKGNRKTLDESDLYQPLKDQKADTLGNDLEKETEGNTSLLKCLLRTFGFRLLQQGIILLFIECGVKILPPIFLSHIITYYSNQNGTVTSTDDVVWYSVGIILAILLNVVIVHAFDVSNLNLGFMIKTGVGSLIYRKCLRLSKAYVGKITTGKIINMMSTDVAKFEAVVLWMHYLWVGPLQTILVTWLMYREIGISALSGVVILLIFLPLQLYLAKRTSVLRFETASRTDKRVQLMNEIIQGIQVIKMYAWEKPFNKLVSKSRINETKLIRIYSWIRGILLSFIIFAAPVSIFTSLVMYALLGNKVTAQKAFVVIAFFNVLKFTMIVKYPFAMNFVTDCRISIKRIGGFLDDAKCLKTIQNFDKNRPIKVEVKNVTAKWDSEQTDKTISNISFSIEHYSTVGIVGVVGSGKSSIIQVLIGELPIDSGELTVNGIISYASQEPWLFSGTVQENILFGEPLDDERYMQVLSACFLTRDMEIWPNGDNTMVGERGVNLSGGQKARINLARALYRKADIYLLDDPLSAVDSHVGRHLFENCVKKFLKDKLVIMVTHQLHHLSDVDGIIVMEEGRVQGNGTLEELRDLGLDFTKLLHSQDIESDKDLHSNEILATEVDTNTNEIIKVNSKPVQAKNEEKRAEGFINMSYYKSYFTAAGGCTALVVLTLFTVSQVFTSLSDYFISYWVRKQDTRSIDFGNETVIVDVDNDSEATTNDRTRDIIIFSALTFGTVLITLSRSFVFFNATTKASRQLHDSMFNGVKRATMYFFNINPSGRILNRFSKDVGQVDETLPFILVDVLQIMFAMVGSICILAVVNPIYLIPTVLLFSIFHFLRKFYLKTSLEVKRLQATTRSPIFSHLAESLTGLTTIRACNIQRKLSQEFDRHQDLHTSAFYIFLVTGRAFGFWLDICCVIYISIVVLSFFAMSASEENVGLAITQAMGLTGMVQLGIKQTASLENSMTSVERIVEYSSIEPEGEFQTAVDKKPPIDWPNKGQIRFEKLGTSYNPDKQDEVLKNLNLQIGAQEKIGIVGRTGAGKSSIINALFRLSFLDGYIHIDEVDTQSIGLYDLRSKISVIPQEPVLFSGSIRYNLDPFDEYSDDKLWDALSQVKLKHIIGEMPAGLSSTLTEGGTNFSVGQRQLMCLARCLLRENKILVIDEATANVDTQTDAFIQETISEKFSTCTVLTIAHRLPTIINSDRVLVMDAGQAVEFDKPYNLLRNENGIFTKMVKALGSHELTRLSQIAQRNYNSKRAK
ncbi:probable multidrug resistance-associated protein lethal(2)03659 [Bradysia coprophila]|uniref:probable multidrug resistance-associated protein lethal(2)03659 n=1 Tax=Bradysia coprophila TaxID=38358 RepID=UPI00187D9C89|nr:probable multidrug resistance-associated protein lethal(2)03659 [Bradysia coprophila]